MPPPKNLSDLFAQGYVQLARLPANNHVDIHALGTLGGYTVPLTTHDYGAKTPVMWNAVYAHLGLRIRNIMVVADPKNLEVIMTALRQDPFYLGGGMAGGFKEVIIPFLDGRNPSDLVSVNLVVKENGRLVGYNTDVRGLYESIADKLSEQSKIVKGGRFAIFGAGGVAKPLARELAQLGASRIVIVNRTVSKAIRLAYEVGIEFQEVEAYGVPEDLIRGTVLNTLRPLDAIINATDKGKDGSLVDTSAFAPEGEYNNTYSIEVLRLLALWNPNCVIVDIVLPKSGRSITLRHAESAKLTNLVDGTPMVINQAVPAYRLIQAAHPALHNALMSFEELKALMKQAAHSVDIKKEE